MAAADDQAAPGDPDLIRVPNPTEPGAFRKALLAEACLYLDEAWVRYIVVSAGPGPAVIIMGRSRAEAAAALFDHMETQAGIAIRGARYKDLDTSAVTLDASEAALNLGDFFKHWGEGAWLLALPEDLSAQHFVSELRPLRTKSANKT